MKKTDVKKLAKKIGLPNANKKESMGLCFVGKIRLKDFLEQKLKSIPGPVYDRQGIKVGEHDGLHNFTIGQRQGIGIGGNRGPWYVAQKSLVDNSLVVTNDPNDEILKIKELQVHSVNWISQVKDLDKGVKLRGRYRHQGELEKLTISPVSNKKKNKDQYYRVVFDKPQLAVASGQSLVLYDKDICVGGGVIV
jgi:tRNA-specific 2-thiouridylase